MGGPWKKWVIPLPGLFIGMEQEEECIFLKAKNGILKGPSPAIFGRVKGKSI